MATSSSSSSFTNVFYFSFIWVLLLSSSAMAINIGGIVDNDTRSGKEECIAMEIAMNDFYGSLADRPGLLIRDSGQDPFRAASSAKTLIKKYNVRAILGMGKWEETAIAAEFGNKSQIPILSLANDVPKWASQQWPFIVNAAHAQYAQMKAMAAMIQTWQWRRVTVIYEETNLAISGIIPFLITAIQDVDSSIDQLLPIRRSPSSNSLSDTLTRLKTSHCRVFIVHTSSCLSADLFVQAKKMGMMEKEFVWITSNEITAQIDSLNSSVISSMQGVVGVKSYFPRKTMKYKSFASKFRALFMSKYPNERFFEPGLFALQAYDALWSIALAIEKETSMKVKTKNQLLDIILSSDFEGLTGEFHFRNGVLKPASIFRIVNVVGKSYRELGYWSDGLGFSESIDEGAKYKSMRALGQVFWPGGPWFVPRGWDLPTSLNPLLIGVPASTSFSDFVQVKTNLSSNVSNVTGFSIDVFKATLERLPYNLSYKLVPFYGTFDHLVEKVQDKIQAYKCWCM